MSEIKKYTHAKPTLGRILLEAMKESEISDGGIFLPGGQQDSASVMQVIEVCEPYEAAADDQDDSPSGPLFQKGAVVVIGKYNGVEIQIGRRKFTVVRESDILLTLHEEEPE